jgi:hypothetical protein
MAGVPRMVWTGTAETRAWLDSPEGGPVRVGDFLLPRKVTYNFEGDGGNPDLHVRFEVRDGRPECVEIRLTAKPGGRGLRTSDTQVLTLDAMKIGVFAETAHQVRYDPETNGTRSSRISDEREFWRALNEVDAVVKAPQRGVTQAELEQVAQVYADNVQGAPIKAVRAVLGYSSERTATRRVQQARAEGLLPATTVGKRKA